MRVFDFDSVGDGEKKGKGEPWGGVGGNVVAGKGRRRKGDASWAVYPTLFFKFLFLKVSSVIYDWKW